MTQAKIQYDIYHVLLSGKVRATSKPILAGLLTVKAIVGL